MLRDTTNKGLKFNLFGTVKREREDTRQPRNTSHDIKINTKFFVAAGVSRLLGNTISSLYRGAAWHRSR